MATIILGLCCLSSMLGSGYMAYNEIKKSQKKDENEKRASEIAQTPGLHMFTDCDYSGEGVFKVTGDSLPVTEKDETIISVEGIKSFVLTDGYKLDTYNKADLNGIKITFTGPQNTSCNNRVIKSVRFYKA